MKHGFGLREEAAVPEGPSWDLKQVPLTDNHFTTVQPILHKLLLLYYDVIILLHIILVYIY